MEVKTSFKNKVKKFVSDHKTDILLFGGGAVLTVVGIKIISKTCIKRGYEMGVHAAGFVSGAPAELRYSLIEDGYKIGIYGPTYGLGDLQHDLILTSENAIIVAKDILKDLGCLKEVIEIPEAAEVVTNG